MDFKSFDSNPKNFPEFSLKIRKLSSGPPLGKLVASCLPTLAPEGAQTLPMNLLSDSMSTSIVLLPLLLYRTLQLSEVIFGKLF
jgi:hypothetical protein